MSGGLPVYIGTKLAGTIALYYIGARKSIAVAVLQIQNIPIHSIQHCCPRHTHTIATI